LNNDQVSSGIWFFIGVTICLASLQYRIGTLSSPGSGFMPLLSGLAIAFLSIVGFIHATIRKNRDETWTGILRAVHWEKALIVVISLFAYGFLMGTIGFFSSTFLFIGFLLRIIVPHRWSWVIGGSLLISVSSYIVFEILLRAQMPKGFLGF
jgi:hypothetical protein